MEEYLPPIVTKLKADLSDLVAGLIEARALVRDYAAGSHKDMVDAFADSGRDSGALFGREFHKSSSHYLNNFQSDMKRLASAAGDDSGSNFAGSFFKSFGSFFMSHPLIALILMSIPILGPLLGGLIASAFAIAFAGIAGFILKSQPPLIAAALRLKQTVIDVFKDAALPMLDPLVKALDIFTALVKELGPAFKTAFGYAAQTVVPLAQGIAAMFRNMMPGLNSMLSKKEVVEAFATGLGALGSGLGDFFEQITAHGPELARFMTDFMIALANVVRWLGYFINYLVVMYDTVHKSSVAIGKGIGVTVSAIGHAVTSVGNGVRSAVGTVKGWVNAVGDWFSSLGNAASNGVDKAVHWFSALPGRIWTALRALPGVVERAAVDAFDRFFFMVGFVFTKVFVFLMGLPTRLRYILLDAEIAVIQWVQGLSRRVEETVTSLPGKISSAFSRAWAAAVDWVTRLYWDVTGWIYKAMVTAGEFLDSLPGRAVKAFNNFMTSAKNFYADLGKFWRDLGKNLLEALISGFTSALDWAVSVVERAMDKIKQGARRALGIESPSKVFRQLGSYTMQGYIQGLLSQQGSLGRVWERMGMPSMPVPAMGIAGGSATAMAAAAAPSYRPSSDRGSDGAMLDATINLDGVQLMNALVPVAQKQKARTGTTGLS